MINVVLLDLPTTVRGFCKKCGDDYAIVINARMSDDMRKRAYLHEVAHILGGDLDQEESAGEIEEKRHKSTPANGGVDGGE